jgi:hypothetical protein
MIKTPALGEEPQKVNPEIRLSKNYVKVDMDNKNKKLAREMSSDNQDYRNALEQLYKLHSMNSSEALLLMGNEYRPTSSTYAVRSHIPVMHKIKLEFQDFKKVV